MGVVSWPLTPHPGRAPGGPATQATTLKLCFVGGGGGDECPQGKKGNQRKNNKPRIGVSNSTEFKHPPAPSWLRKFPLPTHQPDFHCLFLTFQLQFKRHQRSQGCLSNVSLGSRESLKKPGLRRLGNNCLYSIPSLFNSAHVALIFFFFFLIQ